MKNNIKKSGLAAILAILFLSGCSTYEKFSERKYYNFPYSKSETASLQKQHPLKTLNALSPTEIVTDAFNTHTQIEKDPVITASLQKIALPVSIINYNPISTDINAPGTVTIKTGIKSFEKKTRNEKTELAAGKKGAGFALLFSGIGVFVIGIVFLLVISALFGAVLMVAGVALLIVGIILLATSKE